MSVSPKPVTASTLAIILFLTILAYSNTFYGEFQFDDDLTIVYNQRVKDLSRFFANNPLRNMVHGGRPATDFTFALNYHLGGLNVFGYHIFNLFIHIINGLLLYYLVLLTMRSPLIPSEGEDRNRAPVIAVLSSALFLLHPVQTQAVSYISQRSESLAALFYLCSLIAYIKARLTPSLTLPPRGGGLGRGDGSELQTQRLKSILWYLTSVISGILAMGSKVIAITIPVIILMYDFYFLRERPFLKRIAGPGIFILLSFIMGIFIIIGLSTGIEAGFSVKTFTPWTYLMTQFRVLTTYIRLLFLPINQNVDYDFRVSKSLFETETVLSLIFLLIIVIFAIAIFKKWRVGSFFILWFFIILAPTSSIIPVLDPIFEHRVYLASAGIFIALIDSFFRTGLHHFIKERFPDTGTFAIVIAAVALLLTLSVATFQRNKVWQTKLSLWEDAAKKSPMKSRVHNNLGNCYFLLDRYFEAIKEYEKAIYLDKNNLGVYFNLALSYDKAGLVNYALAYYEHFYQVAPPEAKETKEEVKRRIDSLKRMIDEGRKK